MKNKKVIIFGPWVGEFSYELSWWNPEIRKVRNEHYKDYYAVHIGFKGRRAMYKDFIDEYVSIPKELENKLKYPALNGEHIREVGEVIPDYITDFLHEVASKYHGDYDEIVHYSTTTMPMNSRTNEELPFGEYINYEVDSKIEEKVNKDINNYFSKLGTESKDCIAIMARIRDRDRGENTEGCYLNWNPKSWEIFLDRVINELDTNIVIISISKRNAAGGSLSFKETEFYEKNKKNIMIMDFNDDDDSLEKQLGLLKSTKCSIYGASGSAVLPFFIKTPTFTQQTVEEGFRLKYQWERNLTDNLKNIKIFDKYHSGEDLYDSSSDELFEEFKEFYRGL
jgi:hypothetical protein